MQGSNTTNSSSVLLPDEGQNTTDVPALGDPDGCLIEPQLAFIAAATSGSLILVLLISLSVLSCKFVALKRRWHARRLARSNAVRVAGSGHRGSERMKEGIVGPCETNLLLEEIQNEAEEEEEVANEAGKEAESRKGTSRKTDEEKAPGTKQISTSRDSCREPAKELEDMPLVV